MEKKKIILFSPNGYIGGYIKERVLEEKKFQLYTMTRDSDWSQYNEKYDVMIYSAAITSARCEKADKYVQDNVVTALSVVNFCKQHFVKRIIYLSSDEIYGVLNTEIVNDRSIMIEPNLYATTKYLAEKIIIASNIPYYILRLPGVVGKIWGNNFIYNLMTKIKNNECIKLYNCDKYFNNIVDIDDLTNFITLLFDLSDTKTNEVLLLGNIEKMKLKEIVFTIKKLYHSSSQICNINDENKRCFTLDVSKAVEYGYMSKNIETIIKELYEIQKRQV